MFAANDSLEQAERLTGVPWSRFCNPNSMRTNLSFVAALAAAACLSPTEACSCPPALGIGVLTGTVRRADASPVAGAPVHVTALLRGCADSLNALVDDATTITDISGAYAYQLRAMIPTDTACIRVVAYDPSSPTPDSVTMEGIRMRLVPSYGTSREQDTLNVALQFP
jgi:hypothetical protein